MNRDQGPDSLVIINPSLLDVVKTGLLFEGLSLNG